MNYPLKTACLMLSCCMSFLLYKYLLQLFPSVMTEQLMQSFHLTGSGLGNLAASFFYGYVIAQVFAGLIVDRYGICLPSVLALLLASVGVYGFSVSTHQWLAMSFRMMMGGGAAFATVTYLRCSSLWFPKRLQGLTGGLLTVGVMVGAVCAQAPLALFIHSIGARDALLWIAVLGLLLASLALCILREPKAALGISTVSLRNTMGELIKNRRNWLLMLYSGLAFAPLAVFGGLWGTPYIEVAAVSYTHLRAPEPKANGGWRGVG